MIALGVVNLARDPLLSDLTDQQKSVAIDESDAISVIAAAGSGKTKTLVAFVLNQLLAGLRPEQTVVFTFTEKAAHELRARIFSLAAAVAPELNLDGLYVGTIHGWCYQLLQNQKGNSDLLVLDDLHLQGMFLRLYDHLGIAEYSGYEFPKGVQIALDDMELAWNEGIENIQSPELRELYEKFESFLSENKMTTYGSMQHAALRILANLSVFETRLVCIDEYQDVNLIQEELVLEFRRLGSKIFAVGDPRQSIYQWRGADPGRLLRLGDRVPQISRHELSVNFRSTEALVAFSNQVSEQLLNFDHLSPMEHFRKNSTLSPLTFVQSNSPKKQAEQIADWVINLREQGAEWGDIAILMRSVKHNIEELVFELENRGIPVGGSIAQNGTQFLEDFVLPTLRWLVYAAKWREGLDDNEMEQVSSQLEDALAGEIQDFDRFWLALNNWRDDLAAGGSMAYDLRNCFFRFIDEAGLHVGISDSERLNGIALTSQYMRAMEEVYRRRLKVSSRKNPIQIVAELIFRISVSSTDYGETRPLVQDREKITLTTVHKAKGLEWPHVIVPNIQNGLFPLRPRKRSTKTGDEVLSSKYGTTLQEELRILYVAATRARDTLLLISPVELNEPQHPVAGPVNNSGASKFVAPIVPPRLGDLAHLGSPAGEYLSIGLADLLVHDECGFEYGLRKIAGVQPSIGQELGYGLGLHEVLRERIESQSQWPIEQFRERANDLVRLPYMSESDESKSRARIAEVAFSLQALGLLDGKYESELRTSILIGNAVINGSIDGVLDLGGKVIVRDWKTNIHDNLRDKYDRQIALYAMALQDKGVQLDGAEYIDASASAKQKKVEKVEVDVSSSKISHLRKQMERVTLEIAEGRVEPKPSARSCSSCDVSRICSYRKQGG